MIEAISCVRKTLKKFLSALKKKIFIFQKTTYENKEWGDILKKRCMSFSKEKVIAVVTKMQKTTKISDLYYTTKIKYRFLLLLLPLISDIHLYLKNCYAAVSENEKIKL